jgi:DNA-binding transcriptional MerR regulator
MPSNATAAQTATEENLHSIGDVSRMTNVKPFVLRYWESEFSMLQPVKTSRGFRMYRQEDVELVLKIKRLLYDEGFTIAGARRYLRDHSAAGESENGGENSGGLSMHAENAGQVLSRKMLLDLRDTLRAFLTLLERR